jgi:hypothetical protein
MFLFSHPWTGILMTCTGLACLSAMGLTLRSTFRLGRETETEEKENIGHDGSGELATAVPRPTRAVAVARPVTLTACDNSIARRYSQ